MVKKKNHLRNQTNKQTNNRTNNNKNEKVIPLTSILPVSKNLWSKHITVYVMEWFYLLCAISF